METCSNELSADVWNTSRLRRGLRAVETRRDAACDRTACRHSEWAEDQVAEVEEGWKLRRPTTRLQLKSRQTSECLTRIRMYATALLDRAWPGRFLNR
jgi:hypothetical protein